MLKDKVVLITGSTTGIGEAIARRSVAEGARVMVHGRREESAQEICRELGEDAAAYVTADLADAASGSQTIQATVERFGRIDCLVNNAASTARSDIDTTTPEFFDKMIAINLRAPLFLIQAAMPHFRAQGHGTVLNIGSINALSGEPNLLAYSASKGGLQTLTRNLANTHATEKIRFNQLNVGWVTSENEIALKISEGLAPDWYKNVPPEYAPFGRLQTPEQIASHAVFWISEQSYPANGVVYEVDQTSPYGRNPAKVQW
ncbi:MAG: oxidoreductase [Chloroflexota bacterium]